MPAGIVGNDRMRDAVLPQFPGGEAGALVARPGFVDPDMEGDALVMGAVDRRERRAPIDRRQPAGIAMGKDLDCAAAGLYAKRRLDQAEPMLAEPAVDRDVLL